MGPERSVWKRIRGVYAEEIQNKLSIEPFKKVSNSSSLVFPKKTFISYFHIIDLFIYAYPKLGNNIAKENRAEPLQGHYKIIPELSHY